MACQPDLSRPGWPAGPGDGPSLRGLLRPQHLIPTFPRQPARGAAAPAAPSPFCTHKRPLPEKRGVFGRLGREGEGNGNQDTGEDVTSSCSGNCFPSLGAGHALVGLRPAGGATGQGGDGRPHSGKPVAFSRPCVRRVAFSHHQPCQAWKGHRVQHFGWGGGLCTKEASLHTLPLMTEWHPCLRDTGTTMCPLLCHLSF